MIHIVKGNLLESDCEVIAHQCNCFGAFGSGIAKQIREKFPYAYESFASDERIPEEKLSTFTFAMPKDKEFPIIFNLYGQLKYGKHPDIRYTDYEALRKALIEMIKWVKDFEDFRERDVKIGLPYGIGAGLGNGNWNIILGIIEDVSEMYDHDIYLFELN